jgi:hypothetical protein
VFAVALESTPIIVALIGFAGIIVTVWAAARSVNRKVAVVHEEVRTNHGKRQGQRIEELGDAVEALVVAQTVIVGELTKIKMGADLSKAMIEQVGTKLAHNVQWQASHDAADAERFGEIHVQLGEVLGNQARIKAEGEAMTEKVARELEAIRQEGDIPSPSSERSTA